MNARELAKALKQNRHVLDKAWLAGTPIPAPACMEEAAQALVLLAEECQAWRDAWGESIEMKCSGNWGYPRKQDYEDLKPLNDAKNATDTAHLLKG